MVEGTNNNKSKNCKNKNWQLDVRLWQDDRLMMDSGQYVSQVQRKQNPKNTEEMPDCYSQCVALTNGLECSLVYTADNTSSYWGFQSSGMWCCVIGCAPSNIWKDRLTCQDHSPSILSQRTWILSSLLWEPQILQDVVRVAEYWM